MVSIFGRLALGIGGLRHEQVDDVLAPFVDHGADRARVEVIEPAADQGKTLRGEVDHRRRDVELAVEPGFYGVLVGRDHVDQMAGLQRAQMRRDDLGFDALCVVVAQHDGDKPGRRQRRYRRSHRKTAQHRTPARHRHDFSRFWLRQRGLDAFAQGGRRGVAQIGAGDGRAHGAVVGQRGRAAWAAGDVLFDLAGVPGIELAVDQCVEQDLRFVAGHVRCSSAAVHAERSMARARARRDITVPTGAATMSAISRYERL